MVAALESDAMEVDIGEVTVIVSEKNPQIRFSDIDKILNYIIQGVEKSQSRLIQRAIRLNANIRKYATVQQLQDLIDKYITISTPTYSHMIDLINLLKNKVGVSEDINTMTLESKENVLPLKTLPEVEVYIYTLLVTVLLREKLDNEAVIASTQLVDRIRSMNRRSMDLLASKAFFYFSLAYERVNKLENIRTMLLLLYRTACIHQDEISQAVLLNLLLRNFTYYNLIDQAQTFALRANFPDNASNNQFCRYLYYMGRIQAIQLEYSDAYQRLLMASRKAPQDVAFGFTRIVTKLMIIVQLLMGEIPERIIFNQERMKDALKPYFHLTQAVRNGDLQQFTFVSEKYAQVFQADAVNTLVKRLSHNVIKTGLRKISISYSRISLHDVAFKLHLPSRDSAEYICAKAIRDGVIEATIDHENGWLLTSETIDLYSTEEPQKAFHKRIMFCLDVHNEAVKSMRYPPDAYKRIHNPEGSSKRESNDDDKTIEDIIKEMEEDLE